MKANLRALIKQLPVSALQLAQRLNMHGYEAYVVGGCIRDSLLGLAIGDIDFATNARPEVVETLFSTKPTGKAFGTITVMCPPEYYQLTTFRSERHYSNQRHPDDCTFEQSIHTDLLRRDFTINAFAFDPISHVFIDNFNGLADLHARRLHCVGECKKRFAEDSLRPFRLFRLMSQLDFSPSTAVIKALHELSTDQLLPSKERLSKEAQAIISGKAVDKALRLMQETGYFKRLFPELSPCLVATKPTLAQLSIPQRWAHLLYKAKASAIMTRLCFSHKNKQQILALIYHGLDEKKASFSTKDLALRGQDLLNLGFSGKTIGHIQHYLHQHVINDFSLNTKKSLLDLVKPFMANKVIINKKSKS